jgi:hypothetical protein
MAGLALAQRTGAIVHVDLRNGAERELARRPEREGGLQDSGRDPKSDQIRELTLRGRKREP